MWTDSLPHGSKASSSVPSGKGQQSISWAAILYNCFCKLRSLNCCLLFRVGLFWVSDLIFSNVSGLLTCICFGHSPLSLQAVWPACLGRAGKGIQAEWEDGHEAADLWTQELEQFYLFETGRVRRATALCFAYLYPNAADGHVDGAPENEEDLLAKGTFTCFIEFRISFIWWSVLLGPFFPLVPEEYLQKTS